MSATGIGAAVRRKEDLRFITGRGQYTDDVIRPGETRAVFVRSPHAHAKIKNIDTSAAKKMPGVIAVLTGAELANDKIGNLICGWMIHSKDGTPMKMAPHPALAVGKVNHQGDAVAFLALLLTGALALPLRKSPSPALVLGGGVVAAVLFHVVTITPIWLAEPAYAKSPAGLWQALWSGLPSYPTPTWTFLRNLVTANVVFTALFLLARRSWLPAAEASTPAIAQTR